MGAFCHSSTIRGGRCLLGAAIPCAQSAERRGLSERVYMCVRECTCEMWRRPPRRSCMLGKNMNNQHIAHTSAESWEGAGRSRGLSPAGWREAGTTRIRRGHFRVALQLSFASTELRNRKKGEWEEVIFILFLFKGLTLHANCGVLKVED